MQTSTDDRLPVSQGGGVFGIAPQYADRVSQFLRMDEMTEQGIYGDPTYGSAEKGERMFEAIAGCLADIVGDLQGGRL